MEPEPSPEATPAQREQRKVVTALFADVVGSTALSEALDAEDVKLVVGEAVARIVREVEALGGYVKDLAGDGVLAFFGAPIASEDDAERAARVALRVLDQLAAYGREVESAWGIAGFGVRIGVSTGPVVLGTVGAGSRVEYAAFGQTVNRAARLQAAAEPGIVLVDEPTRRELEGIVDTDAPVELSLKGLADPVRAYPLRAIRGFAQRRGRRLGIDTQLFGREREVASAAAWLDRVRSGSGGMLVIAGEAGIGKSRLLGELQRRFMEAPLDGTDPAWLEGRCVSYGESLPLWPIRDLLRHWLGVSEEPELRVRLLLRRRLEALFGDRTPELYPYLASVLGITLEPDGVARLTALSPEALQYRTFEVISTLIEELAQRGPVVVAVEDLHWADPTSVQLLEQLLPLTEQAALLLVIAHREERDHPSWSLREQAARQYPHLLRELSLEPLSGDAERELLHSLAGRDTLPSSVADQLLRQAEGNPFFL
ncbi:MAG TPA: AAA family ATPase, partial [Vitreimonas sp.]|nr:AAA family ATPase [Vitreimonas sp.]